MRARLNNPLSDNGFETCPDAVLVNTAPTLDFLARERVVSTKYWATRLVALTTAFIESTTTVPQ